jgi:hypothetical protein
LDVYIRVWNAAALRIPAQSPSCRTPSGDGAPRADGIVVDPTPAG